MQKRKNHFFLINIKMLTNVFMVFLIGGCNANERANVSSSKSGKFGSIKGVILVVDAVPGIEKRGVEFFSDSGALFYSKSLVSQKTREVLALNALSMPIPKNVRVIWHEGNWNYKKGKSGNSEVAGGVVTGDYVASVANRIPNAVLNSIRQDGGALRLKFRLKEDGVLFGWDIERPSGGISKFDMAGGDFLDTKY